MDADPAPPAATSLQSRRFTGQPASTVRITGLVVFFCVLGWRWTTNGIPNERTPLFAWLLSGVALWSIGQTDSKAFRLFWDWAPMMAMLALYDLIRGIADNSGMPLQLESLVRIEETLFGSPIPTIRWQQGLIVPDGPVHWWEAAVAVCYSSHFVASLTLMGALWVFDRENGFLPFRRRFTVVTLLGLLGYLLVPSAPPWMAARDGVIEPVRRLSLRGFQVFGGDGAEKAITAGAKFSNQVAAMPSLHGAWSLLIALFLTRYLPRWSWPLLLAYPALMLFSLVSTGEHYVIDVLAGFACVGVAFGLARAIERVGKTRSGLPIGVRLISVRGQSAGNAETN